MRGLRTLAVAATSAVLVMGQAVAVFACEQHQTAAITAPARSTTAKYHSLTIAPSRCGTPACIVMRLRAYTLRQPVTETSSADVGDRGWGRSREGRGPTARQAGPASRRTPRVGTCPSASGWFSGRSQRILSALFGRNRSGGPYDAVNFAMMCSWTPCRGCAEP